MPLFVVALSEVLVAQDVAMMIGDLCPGARIVQVRSAGDAVLLGRDAVIHTVFVQDNAARFARSALGAHLALTSARIVLVGQEANDLARAKGWAVLPIPFCVQDVATLISLSADA